MIVSFELSVLRTQPSRVVIMAFPLATDFPELAHLSSVSIKSFFAAALISLLGVKILKM